MLALSITTINRKRYPIPPAKPPFLQLKDETKTKIRVSHLEKLEKMKKNDKRTLVKYLKTGKYILNE